LPFFVFPRHAVLWCDCVSYSVNTAGKVPLYPRPSFDFFFITDRIGAFWFTPGTRLGVASRRPEVLFFLICLSGSLGSLLPFDSIFPIFRFSGVVAFCPFFLSGCRLRIARMFHCHPGFRTGCLRCRPFFLFDCTLTSISSFVMLSRMCCLDYSN